MTSRTIIEDTFVVAADNLASADLDGEAILLNINTGYYYGLNEVGARIMDLMQEPTSLAAIMDRLLEEYEVETAHLERDLMTFLQEMEDRQLIRVMNGVVT